MSLIQLRQSIGSELLRNSQKLTDDQREVLGRTAVALKGMVNWLEGVSLQLNQEVDMGVPDDGSGTPSRGNIRGQWVKVTVTSGLGGAFTFTHNFNLPLVVVPGRAYNHPNIFWSCMRVVYGDRTGTNGAPAAGGATAHTSVYFRYGDTVTANAIDLRVQSDLTAGATTPIEVALYIHPGVA